MRLFQMLCVSQVRQTTVRSWWAQSPCALGCVRDCHRGLSGN
jgi:hypothetical protein